MVMPIDLILLNGYFYNYLIIKFLIKKHYTHNNPATTKLKP